jgi:hypothetical protein
MISRTAVLALFIAAGALGACGKQGELERPAPLVGKAQTGPSAAKLKRDQAAARARNDGAVNADPQAPQSVDEVRNLGVQTQREHPVSGVSEGPNPQHPPGLLPDPAARPSKIPE